MSTSWISRRKMMQYTLAAAAGFAVRSSFVRADEPAEDPMKKMWSGKLEVTPLADGLSMVSGGGGNVVIGVGGEGVLVIDSMMSFRGKDLVAVAEQLAPAVKHKVLFNTHWHFDHVGGNPDFAAAGYVIAGSAACRKRMGETIVLEDMGLTAQPAPETARPSITFEETMQLFAGSTAVVTKFAPAHTDTDAAIVFSDKGVVQTGDLLFNGIFPVIDRSTGGSLDGMIAASKRLLGMVDDKTKVVPGHGPLGDKSSIQGQLDLLNLTRERLAPFGDKKTSMVEVLAKAPLADLDEKWGRGFLRSPVYTRMAYGQWSAAKN